MPPFAAPIPGDEPQEPPKGRRPYASPTGEPEDEPRRRPRRIVNRPDKLVAGGPPRPDPSAPDEPRPGAAVQGEPRPDTAVPGERRPDAGEVPPPRREAAAAQAEVPHVPRPRPEGDAAPPPVVTPGKDAGTPVQDAGTPDQDAGTPDQDATIPAQDTGPGNGERRDRIPPYRLVYPLPTGEETRAAEDAHEESGHDDGDDDGDGDGDGEWRDEPEVRRVGRPPAGRPTRPDLLVAGGDTAGQGAGGRHHRGPAPAAVRRSSPVRRRTRAIPIVLTVAAAILVATGVLVWRWSDDEGAGLRLEAGTGRSGDELFTIPAAGVGTDQKLNDMTSVGRAVVAVGSDTTSPTPRPLFLFSPNGGKTWQLGQVNGASSAIVRRVVGGEGRWLASGGDEATGERGLWTSTDGYSWTAVPSSGLAAFRTGDRIEDIARTGSGFVAVGSTAGADGGTGPAAWRSDDGRAWERVETRELGVRALKAVVAKGDTAVAIGVPADGEGSRVLRSANGGRAWQATGFQLPEATDPRAGTVAVLPKRFVLVPMRRRTPEGDVRVYCSPTGAQWSQCGSIGGLAPESVGVETMISYPSGVAAISPVGMGSYTVLTTTDGRSWTKRADLGNLTGATLRGFTISDGGTLFAGGDRAASDVDNQLVLMAAPPRGTAARVPLGNVEGLTRIARETNALTSHGGRYVAVGSASGDAGLWTIRNWQSWKSMSLGGTGRQTLEDVTYGSRGWLAVGGTEPNAGVTDPLLVTSTDGENWKRVDVTGDLARRPDQLYLRTDVVTAGKKGYVLAGESRDQSGATGAAMWFTPDTRKYTRSSKLPQGGAGVRVHDVTAVGDGYVAVGGSGGADQERTVVWYSEDGVNWTARDAVSPPDATSAGLRRVAAYQGKLVAIGTAMTNGARRAFAAVSGDDGQSWETAWLPTDQAAAVYDLAAAQEGLVAVGWHGVPGEGDSAAWTSQDGLSWNRVALTKDRLAGQGTQWLSAVAVDGSEVVALGRSTTYNADHLILWTSSLTSSR
ncbi:hypothetical protein HCN51_47180 [Nonomuraea sp. FMUSA5-5]|uniref:DUF6242 domain-containing protein n=1 Tax=Nonomuraea composti TaxID=2720023 RepID=A0ABX1BQ80_9ACTN|nr:hypothetical protein [Nonomuraea sp. FMUSA5-5]NJP96928.1 hypothetical protein [Nonomuraea sp. FMUSA5-5]